MREHFAAWYPLNDEDRRRFITTGLVVVDTNVLLDLYRINRDARKDVFSLFRHLGDRLWIPHQVGLEFHRNRLTVIYDQEQTDQKIRTAITEAGGKLDEAIRSIRDHPVIDRKILGKKVEDALESITAYLDEAGKQPRLSVREAMSNDPILDEITLLLSAKVGPPYSDDQMAKVSAEAKKRIESKRPPGYADTKKSDDRSGGDYIVWRQMLDEAARRKAPVLFVTNDQKEDWYRRLHGLTIGPRIELVTEMENEAGVAFHAQTLARFVEMAPALLQSDVQETTVTEVNRLDEVARATQWGHLVPEPSVAGRAPRTLSSSLTEEKNSADWHDTGLLRLIGHRDEILLRMHKLQEDLEAAKRASESGRVDREDPRSYVRAVEARLAADEEVLSELTGILKRVIPQRAKDDV